MLNSLLKFRPGFSEGLVARKQGCSKEAGIEGFEIQIQDLTFEEIDFITNKLLANGCGSPYKRLSQNSHDPEFYNKIPCLCSNKRFWCNRFSTGIKSFKLLCK